MKKRIIFLALFCLTAFSAFAQEQGLKFHLRGGKSKEYRISNIDYIGLNKLDSIGMMKLRLHDNQIIYYPTTSVDSVTFYKDPNLTHRIVFHHKGLLDNYALNEIDSISFLNLYESVTIGKQLWMKRNLNVDHYSNGDPIPQITDPDEWANTKSGAWCYYNNDPEMGKIYGKLYNWYAVNDPRGLAPEGWHVPNFQEWVVLMLYFGDMSTQGGKMKEADTTHWASPNTGATNVSAFTALPGGGRSSYGVFYNNTFNGYWWVTRSGKENDSRWSLEFDRADINTLSSDFADGYSVRCIISPLINSISPKSAQIGDIVTIKGLRFGDTRSTSYVSFAGTKVTEYLSWSDTEIKVKVPKGTISGKVWVNVNEGNSNEKDFKTIWMNTEIETVLIPWGRFQMGETGAYPDDNHNDTQFDDEKPVHTVTISRDLLMSKYEIKQNQYEELMGYNPSSHMGDNLPVQLLSHPWDDLIIFCNRLSDKEGLERCYKYFQNDSTLVLCNWDANGYRLPTEAEWEYACKAGSTTDFYIGDLTNTGCAPIDGNLNKIGWYCGNSGNQPHPVGQKEPNAWGLYDMIGNVWEYCWDWYGQYYEDAVVDPKGRPEKDFYHPFHIFRGGDVTNNSQDCRSSYRSNNVTKSNFCGFRVCRLNK